IWVSKAMTPSNPCCTTTSSAIAVPPDHVSAPSVLDELQLVTHLLGPENPDVHALQQELGARHEFGVGGLVAGPEVEVVLQTDAHVAAGQRGHGDEGDLHLADRERREHAIVREVVDHRHERVRVVRSTVRDAHAQLDHHRVVEQPVADQLFHLHEVARVEHLELRTHAELLHLARHRAQHTGCVDHDVVAAGGEVHRSAVERADLGHQRAYVVEALGGTSHVVAVRIDRQHLLVAAQHQIATHSCWEGGYNVDARRQGPLV